MAVKCESFYEDSNIHYNTSLRISRMMSAYIAHYLIRQKRISGYGRRLSPTQWKGNRYHAVHVIFAHCRGSVRRSRVTGSSLIVRTNTEGRHVSIQMKLEYGFAHGYKSHSYHFLLHQLSVTIEHLHSRSTALAELADYLARSSTTSPSQLNSIRHAHSLPVLQALEAWLQNPSED